MWFCDTNSAHQHSTEWEASTCSEMWALLQSCLVAMEEGAWDDEALRARVMGLTKV